MENPEINPHLYGWLTFDKGTKNSVEKDGLFKMVLGKMDILKQKNVSELLHYTTHKN